MVTRDDAYPILDPATVGGHPKLVLMVTAEMTALTFYRGYVRFLTDLGWEVIVVCRSAGKLEAWAKGEGGTGVSVPFVREPSPWADLKALLAVIRLLRRIRPSVVVTATPKAGLLGTLGALIAGVPVRQYQLWGLRLETERGSKRQILHFLEKTAIWSSTQTLANSRSLANRAEDLNLVRAGKVEVLGDGSSHGVDVEYFDRGVVIPAVEALEEFVERVKPELTVVYIGRLARDKGMDTLMEALTKCASDGRRVAAVIVGGVEHVEVEELLKAQTGVDLFMAGAVDDVRPYIKAADVLCLPTLREGFPNVVLEAAAMQVPALVTDATGAVDSVIDEETGLVFPVGDAHALAVHLVRLIDSPKLINEMGYAARKRAVTRFSKRRIHHLQASNLKDLHEAVC